MRGVSWGGEEGGGAGKGMEREENAKEGNRSFT